MLFWISFDSFAMQKGSLLQKFHFPIQLVLNSLQTQKDAVFVQFFDKVLFFFL